MSRKHAQDRIVPVLLQKGLVTKDDAERAERLSQSDKGGHGAIYHLIKIQAVTPRVVLTELATFYKIAAVDISAVKIDEATLKLLPRDMIVELRIVPVKQEGNKIYVAMADPTDIDVVDKLRFETNGRASAVVADEYSLEQFLDGQFSQQVDIKAVFAEIAGDDDVIEVVDEIDTAATAMQEEIDAAPAVKLINHTLVDAVKRGASDIHFEFFEGDIRIRYRIDGALIVVSTPPKKYDRALISRLKVMAKLNISERRVPQDGRTKFKVGNRVIDFRVSTLPTTFGEKIVLRILDKSAVSLDLDALGVEPREQDAIKKCIQSPFGMLLVTGPTGSGKTTTLYSILSLLNESDVNILTVEDPVEYDFHGINQVSVNNGKAGDATLDFAKALRAFLRQDPDVIMVGEMRDRETAEIGMRAALTGHLVLSTMHTNDSVSAITRMQEMGIERFNIAAAAKIIVAQRLVRKICTHCKRPEVPDPDLIRINHLEQESRDLPFMKGAGCSECSFTGYRGRVGLYELLSITDAIAELILSGAPASDIKQRAIRDYRMQTLRASGIQKVREGVTTIDEIVRHTTL
jgi:type IV pilus assembly protein PilB